MSEQEVEEQISSEETLNDETGEATESPDNASDKKKTNKSNWKEMSEAKKALERQLAEAQEELNAWRSENPDIITSTLSKKVDGLDKGDLALFLVQNPDAKEHLAEVKEYLAEMKNPDLEKAWKYVKPTLPVESRTEKDFDIRSKGTSKKVDLSKLTFEEIYSEGDYTPEQKREWRKLHSPD